MKRRLLLVNPAHLVDGAVRRGPAQFAMPPLGLGYVAALTPPRWNVRIVDENQGLIDGSDWQPDLVGITVLTPTAPRAYSLADSYRAKGCSVVLGGVHTTTVPDEAGRHADSLVLGEAEPVWSKLLADLEADRLQPVYEGDLPPLAGLLAPRRDLYPQRCYVQTIITSKGCTNTCDFCSIWRLSQRRYRPRPVEEVIDELERLVNSNGAGAPRVVFFADDNLTLDRRRTIELCRLMVDRGIRCRYAIQGTLGLADDVELLRWLARSGCLFVFVGLESLNDSTVAKLGKPDLARIGVDGFAARIARIHAHRMAVFGSFIVGMDGDSPATFDRVGRFTMSAGIDCTLVNILNPIPGTALWDRMVESDRLLYTDFPADYALFSQDNVCFRPTGMTPPELQEGTRALIASVTRLPVSLRRAVATWRHTCNPLAVATALGWNLRTYRSLRHFPARDVRQSVL